MSEQDNNEDLDSQNQTDDGTDNGQDDSVAQTDDIEKLKEQNIHLFERAKKAEGFVKQDDGSWIKKPKPTQPQADSSIKSPPNTDADELRLIARGLSDEEIDQAKVIAKGTSTSLSEAIKSPLFVAFQKELKAQERKEKAKLNASQGSSQEETKSLSGLSREEHQRVAMEAAKNIQ